MNILYWIIGSFLLFNIGVYLLRRRTPTVNDLYEQGLRYVNENTIMLMAEKYKDTFYCYNNKTNEYVCSGKSLKEITDAFKLRHPTKFCAIMHNCYHLFSEKNNAKV
jgi:hypothetical protein